MAVTGNVPSSGARAGSSLGDRIRMTLMGLQALRPDTAGVRARTWLRIHKAMGADAAHIEVTSAGGYIELRGDVASRDIAQRALEIARGAKSVRGVLDFMRVR